MVGDFGTIYKQFKDKPKDAIIFLKIKREGECLSALYRSEIGYIDIVWGENDPKTNKGFGLKHIIEKHGKEIKQLGFEVEDFIVIGVQFGSIIKAKEPHKILLESNMFRIIISSEYYGKSKRYLLTAFDLRKKK
jgi:hypothetical protein